MKIKERISIAISNLWGDLIYSIDWSNKIKIYTTSIIIGFILGNVIRFFIRKR